MVEYKHGYSWEIVGWSEHECHNEWLCKLGYRLEVLVGIDNTWLTYE